MSPRKPLRAVRDMQDQRTAKSAIQHRQRRHVLRQNPQSKMLELLLYRLHCGLGLFLLAMTSLAASATSFFTRYATAVHSNRSESAEGRVLRAQRSR